VHERWWGTLVEATDANSSGGVAWHTVGYFQVAEKGRVCLHIILVVKKRAYDGGGGRRWGSKLLRPPMILKGL
jgi:hypothetical protein